MRRAELVAMVELQRKNFFEAHLANSKFVQKFIELPMIKAAYGTAGDAYVKVKDSNALVGKSIELAINISSAVADKLSPIAEKGISVCSPISTKMDDIATKSLVGLIERVPVIKEEPNEIVQTTRTAIEKKVTVLSGYTESALKTWPVQSALDVYEAILNTACTTLDNVLPANKDENSGSSGEQNGLVSKKDYPAEEEKHKRGIWLAQRTYLMFSTAFRRVFGVCQTQVENAANATDIVYKQVKNVMADGPNANNEASTAANNGDSSNKSKKKNKKNPQD